MDRMWIDLGRRQVFVGGFGVWISLGIDGVDRVAWRRSEIFYFEVSV